MRPAAVGQHCTECVRAGNKGVRQAQTLLGGRVTGAPVATYALIGITVLVYLIELKWNGLENQLSSLGTGVVLTNGGHSIELVGIAHGQWYRLITSAFVHELPTELPFGILHIVFNMWWLWILGRELEEMLGRFRFTALYLLSVLAASVAQFLLAPTVGAIGASGAIYGLAAAYFVVSRRLKHNMAWASRTMVVFLVWMVLVSGFTSWQGHLGGLLAGGALMTAYAYAPPRHRAVTAWCATGGLLLLLIVLTVLQAHSQSSVV
jgi:membrane associated rhomboid family serine protease